MLWGVGTALGEVPPYAISYHAAKAGIKNAEVEALLGVSTNGGGSGGGSGSSEGGVPGMRACVRRRLVGRLMKRSVGGRRLAWVQG